MKSKHSPIISSSTPKNSFFGGLFLSVLLHIALISVLIVSFFFSPPIGNGGKGKEGEAINAVMVNTNQLFHQQAQKKLKAEQERERLAQLAKEKAEREAKHNAAMEEKIRLQKEEQQRLAEEKRQAQEKAKAEEQKRIALETEKKRLQAAKEVQEKARLAEIEKQKEKERLLQEAKAQEEKRLAAEKAKAIAQEKEKQRLVKIKEEKRKAEQKRLAKIKAEEERKAKEEQAQLEAASNFLDGDDFGMTKIGQEGREKCLSYPGTDYERKICEPLMNNFAQGSRQQAGQTCEVSIHIAGNGHILGREIIVGQNFICGNALSAVDKTRNLPSPPKGKAITVDFTFEFTYD